MFVSGCVLGCVLCAPPPQNNLFCVCVPSPNRYILADRFEEITNPEQVSKCDPTPFYFIET